MRRILLLILLFTLLISCKSEKNKNVYYEAPNGKIFTSEKYEEIKLKMSERGEVDEVILSTIERNDSIIKLFKTTVKAHNPYAEIEKIIGKRLPFENLRQINGDKLDLASLKGKPTLVNLWFINCPPCIEEIPHLNRIKKKYRDRVNFLAITFDRKEDVLNFLKKQPFDFIQITNAKNEIDKLNNNSYPLNIYLDKNGVVTSFEGFISMEETDGTKKELEKLL